MSSSPAAANSNAADAVQQPTLQRLPPPSRPKPVALNPSSGVPFGHVPAYLPGSASLVEELDCRIMIVLRDGKHIVGTLISFDQYNNLILQNAVERRIVRRNNSSNNNNNNMSPPPMVYYTDVPLGMYIVRGDSMVLTGKVSSANSSNNNSLMKKVSLQELEELQKDALPPLEWEFDLDLLA